MKIQTSEYCAVGHPDRTCDYIVSYILDRYLERDPKSRVALECQLKDRFCSLAGEVTSSAGFSDDDLAGFCREAVREIGYDGAYLEKWGEGNVVSADDLETTVHISRQSADIACGVDREGWGDQGLFFGLAVDDPRRGYMPKDIFLAREVANALASSGVGGLDVKTQVTVVDSLPAECIVAIPLLPGNAAESYGRIERIVRDRLGPGCRLVVNGTGRYVTHGSVGDCGTTGRKLVVDFYGGNSRIGGGSPWGKDPTKADVALNRLARKRALDWLAGHGLEEVRCAISCAIGGSRIRVTLFDGDGNVISSDSEDCPPSRVIEELSLLEPSYAKACREGLFGVGAR